MLQGYPEFGVSLNWHHRTPMCDVKWCTLFLLSTKVVVSCCMSSLHDWLLQCDVGLRFTWSWAGFNFFLPFSGSCCGAGSQSQNRPASFKWMRKPAFSPEHLKWSEGSLRWINKAEILLLPFDSLPQCIIHDYYQEEGGEGVPLQHSH